MKITVELPEEVLDQYSMVNTLDVMPESTEIHYTDLHGKLRSLEISHNQMANIIYHYKNSRKFIEEQTISPRLAS